MVKLLLDSPVNLKKDDKLHFKEIYSDSIYEILEENEKNFVFGIFGNYGAGKTSIINLLKKNYKKSEVFIVETSIWGFEPIECVKKILINLDEKCETKLKFKKKLNQNEEKIDKNEFDLNFLKILFFLFLSILGILTLYFRSELDIKSVLMPILTLIIFILTYKYGINLISKKIILSPFEISQYEFKLTEFIKKHKKSNLNKPIILIIDDLDRCDLISTCKICKKLELLIESDLNIKILLPFSVKSEEKFIHLKKLVDTFIVIPSLSEFENYKILKEINKND